MSGELINVVVEEVSITGGTFVPVNRRRIALFKGVDMADKKTFEVAEGLAGIVEMIVNPELGKDILAKGAEILKGSAMSEKASEVAKQAMKMLASVKAELPPEFMDQMGKALGFAKAEPKPEPGKDQPADKVAFAKAHNVEPQKDGTYPALFELMFKGHVEQNEKMVAMQKAIDAAAEDKRVNEIRKAVEPLDKVPGKTDDLVEICKGMPKAGLDKLMTILKAAHEQLKESALLKASGSGIDADVSGTKAVVKGRVAELLKAEPKLTEAQAEAKVLKSNPELYDKLEDERQAMIKDKAAR